MLPRLSSMFEYTTGSAMRNVTSTERFRELTHTSARTVILATGTAFTAATSGARSVRTKRNFPARSASRVPQVSPSPKPPSIRPEEKATLRRKPSVGISSRSLPAARTGDTRSNSCPRSIAPTCQTASQKSTQAAVISRFFMLSPP